MQADCSLSRPHRNLTIVTTTKYRLNQSVDLSHTLTSFSSFVSSLAHHPRPRPPPKTLANESIVVSFRHTVVLFANVSLTRRCLFLQLVSTRSLLCRVLTTIATGQHHASSAGAEQYQTEFQVSTRSRSQTTSMQMMPSNVSSRILRLVGTQDPFRLFLDLEQLKKQWFFAQDTRQISKRKRFLQYVLDTRECSLSLSLSLSPMTPSAKNEQR